MDKKNKLAENIQNTGNQCVPAAFPKKGKGKNVVKKGGDLRTGGKK